MRVKYYSGKFAPETKLENYYCSLKNMLLHGIGARGDTNAKTSTAFSKKGEYIENEKHLLNLFDIKVFFFRVESILSKAFLKKTISIFSIHLQHLGNPIDK